MRLTTLQVDSIVSSLTPFVSHEHAELRLYGSRVNDQLKGGDIDLLLLVETASVAEAICEKKHYILAAIKRLLGDQKIDLLITEKHNVHENCFLQMIVPTSIHLKSW